MTPLLVLSSYVLFLSAIILNFIHFCQAIQRLMERNNLPEEEAVKRIDSQISNADRISHANVVLCTLWETEVTQKQVRFRDPSLLRAYSLVTSLKLCFCGSIWMFGVSTFRLRKLGICCREGYPNEKKKCSSLWPLLWFCPLYLWLKSLWRILMRYDAMWNGVKWETRSWLWELCVI